MLSQKALRSVVPMVLCAGVLVLPEAHAYPTPKSLPEGWDAKITVGAKATTGASRNDSVQGSADVSYRNDRWENRLQAKLHRSNVGVSSARTDANGDVVLDDSGEPELVVERQRTNNRRMFGFEPRYFFAERYYVFGLLDLETNKPANIAFSSRQVAGVGYRWWDSKANFLSAGIGLGQKQLELVDADRERAVIGYLGLRLVREVSERSSIDFSIDTDFGSDSRLTEVALGYRWKISDPVSLKLGVESRMNSDVNDPGRPFDESVDAEFTASLVFDVL